MGLLVTFFTASIFFSFVCSILEAYQAPLVVHKMQVLSLLFLDSELSLMHNLKARKLAMLFSDICRIL